MNKKYIILTGLILLILNTILLVIGIPNNYGWMLKGSAILSAIIGGIIYVYIAETFTKNRVETNEYVNVIKIYTTPNNKYSIFSNEYSKWSNSFGTVYFIYDSEFSYAKCFDNLEDAFRWLYKLKVISKDELNEQTSD